MMWWSSARRRHGLARDVLRTSVPVAGQPSQRADWGATARAGGGLQAAVADPVGPRVGRCAGRLWEAQRPSFSDRGRLLDRMVALCDYPR
jgi:hypothetical protein